MASRNYYTITLSLLGVAKLVLNSFGIDLFKDHSINDIANAIATLISFVGVIMTHLKDRPKLTLQFKQIVSNIITKGSGK